MLEDDFSDQNFDLRKATLKTKQPSKVLRSACEYPESSICVKIYICNLNQTFRGPR